MNFKHPLNTARTFNSTVLRNPPHVMDLLFEIGPFSFMIISNGMCHLIHHFHQIPFSMPKRMYVKWSITGIPPRSVNSHLNSALKKYPLYSPETQNTSNKMVCKRSTHFRWKQTSLTSFAREKWLKRFGDSHRIRHSHMAMIKGIHPSTYKGWVTELGVICP